ncbi:MAG: hypothetical protein FWG30_06960 [Eubacteriaceae bacterium]|nr:hypothetical protein [Eubacteriaceae bacterium]
MANRIALTLALLSFLFSTGAPQQQQLNVAVYVQSKTYVYDGAQHEVNSFTYNISGSPASGIRVEWNFSLKETEAGVYDTTSRMARSIRVFRNGNDITSSTNVTVSHGSLLILPAKLGVVAESIQKPYSSEGYQVALGYMQPSGLAPGDELRGTLEASGTNANLYLPSVNGLSVYSTDKRKDVTRNYQIELGGGGLMILPTVSYSYTGFVPDQAESPPQTHALEPNRQHSLPQPASVSGYEFSGWRSEDGYMQDGYLTVPAGVNHAKLSGSFETVSYCISYYIDGELYEACEYAPGQEIEHLEGPSKQGCILVGWDSVPETMPNEDIEAHGHYAKCHNALFYLGNAVYKTQTLHEGQSILPPEASNIKGFIGWSNMPDEMPDEDIAIFAVLEQQESSMYERRAYDSDTMSLVLFSVLSLSFCILSAAYASKLNRRKTFGLSASISLAALAALALTYAGLLSAMRAKGIAALCAAFEAAAFASLILANSKNQPDSDDEARSLSTGEYEIISPKHNSVHQEG